MRLLYTIGIFFYRCGIAVASLFNSKAKLWMRGRKGLFEQLGNTFDGTQRPVWVHCASLGEYEQAKPVIEQIKCVSPHTQVLLTFFSPSGYEVSKSDIVDSIEGTGIALRKEKTVGAKKDGYIWFFVKDGARVQKKGLVYAIDTTGKVQSYVQDLVSREGQVSGEETLRITESLRTFGESFNCGSCA